MEHAFHLPGYVVLLAPLEQTLSEWLRQRDYSRTFILADHNTHEHCLPLFFQKSGLPSTTPVFRTPAGEQYKTLSTCEQIWQTMFDARLDRKALVINLGGGVIGDMGGFCAATYKRGVDFIQIPTTLLAMTDAAIGGKTGVDFDGIKNALGVFRNPAAVFADPAFLQTLPPRELRSGFAEVIKHALIGDPALWEKIRDIPAGQLGVGGSDWFDLLRTSIAVKVRVVTDDPLEKGLRALLNFGHTIGHAAESYFLNTDDPLTHGEAVAIGMICETSRSSAAAERGNATHTVGYAAGPSTSPPSFRGGAGVSRAEVSDIILRHFPHRPIPGDAFPTLWNLILQDKKNASGTVRMAVPGAEPYSLRWTELTREEMAERLEYYNGLKY